LASARESAEEAANEAWGVVERARLSPSWNWPYTKEVEDAWVAFATASAAKETVRAVIPAWVVPDAAATAAAWFGARRRAGIRHALELSGPEATAYDHAWAEGKTEQERMQVSLLHDLIRNPFQPTVTLPAVCPSLATSVATALYEGMPCRYALHDILLDNGATELAAHFASSPHYKGCWALDVILHKRPSSCPA
jgi:hypothetical protein